MPLSKAVSLEEENIDFERIGSDREPKMGKEAIGLMAPFSKRILPDSKKKSSFFNQAEKSNALLQ